MSVVTQTLFTMEVIELRQTRQLTVGDTLVSSSGSAYEVTKLSRIGRGIRVTYVHRRPGGGSVHGGPRGRQPSADHAEWRASNRLQAPPDARQPC